MNIKYNLLGIPWWGERRELDGGCVVENRCVGRHVDKLDIDSKQYSTLKYHFPKYIIRSNGNISFSLH